MHGVPWWKESTRGQAMVPFDCTKAHKGAPRMRRIGTDGALFFGHRSQQRERRRDLKPRNTPDTRKTKWQKGATQPLLATPTRVEIVLRIEAVETEQRRPAGHPLRRDAERIGHI